MLHTHHQTDDLIVVGFVHFHLPDDSPVAQNHRSLSHFESIFKIMCNEYDRKFSTQFLYEATLELVNAALDNYMVSTEQQPLISHQITGAYCDHLKGDEITPDPIIDKEGFGLWLKAVAWYQKDLIHGWRTDLPPADNTLTIDLHTGDSF